MWVARPDAGNGFYLALFNLQDAPQKLSYSWKDLGLRGAEYDLHDLWQHKNMGSAQRITVSLMPHASAIYKISQQ